MPLSIHKLQDLFNAKGFIASKYFVHNDLCFYIELFSIKTADIFFLYIPTKYEIEVQLKDTTVGIYKLRMIDMGVEDNVTDEYAGRPDNLDIEATYGDTHIELSPDKDKIEEHLENNYRHPIALKSISKDDIVDLKALFRQMRRMSYCVQNLKYKLAVVYKNYICSIRRDDSINCFVVKHHPRVDCKKLLAVVDLETFYDKGDKLLEDIHTVRDSIYKVLERNQGMHGRVLSKIIENKKDIAVIPEQMDVKKTKYDNMLNKLESMLSILIESEKTLMAELYDLENNKTADLQSDINRVHHKSRLEKELDKINGIKGDITRTMVAIRDKRENSILNIDKIMFDNTVMFDCIIKNFGMLKDYC